jgi:hypothetical protein
MSDTVFTSRCCGSCRFCDKKFPSWRCRRSRMVKLIVDAFYVCPLWREERTVARVE